jgi:hypothetical protein
MPWRHIWEWRYSSTFLDLGIRLRWVVSFTPLPLGERAPGTYQIGGSVVPRVGLDVVKRKILHYRDSNPGCAARSNTDWAVPPIIHISSSYRRMIKYKIPISVKNKSKWYWNLWTLPSNSCRRVFAGHLYWYTGKKNRPPPIEGQTLKAKDLSRRLFLSWGQKVLNLRYARWVNGLNFESQCLSQTVSEISLRMHHLQSVTQVFKSSSKSYQIIFSAYYGNQTRCTWNLIRS